MTSPDASATDRSVAPTARIRGDFPAPGTDACGPASGLFRRPGRHAGPHRSPRRDGRLPDVAQRQHPLGVPGQRRDGRRPVGGPPHPRRLPQRLAGRDRLRRQHDNAHLPPGPAPWAGLSGRAMPWSSPSWTITPTSTPGVPSSASEASSVLRVKMVPETGQLDWDDLDRCLTDHRTRLLAIGAASNALGTINDVARAVAMAREADALTFVDAVHYAPHQLVNVREWGCDFLACSAYKFYGPHVGVLYGRRDRLESLDVPKLEPAPESTPERLETGTQNHEGIVGAAAAVDYLASLADDATRRGGRGRGASGCGRCSTRSTPAAVRSSPGSGIPGPHRRRPVARAPRRMHPARPRSPSRSATAPPPRSAAAWPRGGSSPRTETSMRPRSPGDWESPRRAWCRIGCACYSTEEEIDRVAEGIGEIAGGR